MTSYQYPSCEWELDRLESFLDMNGVVIGNSIWYFSDLALTLTISYLIYKD